MMPHLFYRGFPKETKDGVTVYRWMHSRVCWCRENMQDRLFQQYYLYPETDYIWKRIKNNYWGDDNGDPLDINEQIALNTGVRFMGDQTI